MKNQTAKSRKKSVPRRGLLPTPLAVRREVDALLKDRPASEAARRRITEEHKLRYFFGGQVVAYRQTSRGVEVLAVGYKEIRALNKRLAPEEVCLYTIDFPDHWR
jgi:hypothetical protein